MTGVIEICENVSNSLQIKSICKLNSLSEFTQVGTE